MADGIQVKPGSGADPIAVTDELTSGAHAGQHAPGVKLVTGADGADGGFVYDANPLPTAEVLNGALEDTAVTVGTSATQLPASNLTGRRRIVIQNLGPFRLYVGKTGVTTVNGIMVDVGGSLTLPAGASMNVFGVAEGASNDVRVLELA